MLILVGVSISIAINGGLFDITKKATKETEEAKNAEQGLASGRVKIGGIWYDTIEDYVNDNPSGNQEESGGENPPVNSPDETAKPEIGDYVKYEPDIVSTSYPVEAKYSGYTGDQTISQDVLNWQILKIHEDGSIDLIGTPTTQTVYFGGALGYNNGVYFMHDICKELYSKKSAGIEARSVSLEDFEDNGNGGIWKTARDAYTNGIAQYNKTKIYTGNNTYYPNLYAQENGSGIKDIDQYYTTPTEETYSQADENGLTVTQTYYNIEINEANYGKSAKVLSQQSNTYWVASRFTSCNSNFVYFGLRYAYTRIFGHTMLFSNSGADGNVYCLRPVVTLKSSAQIELSEEGVNGEPNTFEITKY